MKKTWKWIIGIVVGLIVLALIAGAVLMVLGRFQGYRAEARNGVREPGEYALGPGRMPFGGYGGHMQGFGMMRSGMMRSGMMPFGGIFGGLFSLGVLTLIVLGIVWLVKSLRSPRPVEAVPAAPVVMVHPCPKCGRPVQEDWNNCPSCGKKQ
jgi:hypothetical protein